MNNPSRGTAVTCSSRLEIAPGIGEMHAVRFYVKASNNVASRRAYLPLTVERGKDDGSQAWLCTSQYIELGRHDEAPYKVVIELDEVQRIAHGHEMRGAAECR